jgi:hypothetical protein
VPLPFQERRAVSESAAINLFVVRGLVVMGVLVILGAIVLLAFGAAVPDVLLMIASNIAAGLVGYLSRELRPGSTGVATGHVETVNVEAAPAPTEDPPVTDKE